MKQLDRRRQLRRALRLVARTYAGRQLDQPGTDPLAACLDQPSHRRRHGFRIDVQLPGKLELDQRLGGLALLVRELAVQLDSDLALPWAVELHREDRLPPAQDQPAFLDQEGGGRAQ